MPDFSEAAGIARQIIAQGVPRIEGDLYALGDNQSLGFAIHPYPLDRKTPAYLTTEQQFIDPGTGIADRLAVNITAGYLRINTETGETVQFVPTIYLGYPIGTVSGAVENMAYVPTAEGIVSLPVVPVNDPGDNPYIGIEASIHIQNRPELIHVEVRVTSPDEETPTIGLPFPLPPPDKKLTVPPGKTAGRVYTTTVDFPPPSALTDVMYSLARVNTRLQTALAGLMDRLGTHSERLDAALQEQETNKKVVTDALRWASEALDYTSALRNPALEPPNDQFRKMQILLPVPYEQALSTLEDVADRMKQMEAEEAALDAVPGRLQEVRKTIARMELEVYGDFPALMHLENYIPGYQFSSAGLAGLVEQILSGSLKDSLEKQIGLLDITDYEHLNELLQRSDAASLGLHPERHRILKSYLEWYFYLRSNPDPTDPDKTEENVANMRNVIELIIQVYAGEARDVLSLVSDPDIQWQKVLQSYIEKLSELESEQQALQRLPDDVRERRLHDLGKELYDMNRMHGRALDKLEELRKKETGTDKE